MVAITYIHVPFGEMVAELRQHAASLPSPVDSFLEEHILESNHYRIEVNGVKAGFCAIHAETLITQFGLDLPYRRYGRTIFYGVRHLENVHAAFVPTCDELFLAHALDDSRQVDRQAYFFQTLDGTPPLPPDIHLRVATMDDVEVIRAGAAGFFDRLEDNLAQGKLYLTEQQGACVGFGVIERSMLLPHIASVGMFTLPVFRRRGIGTATICGLITECRRIGRQPIAGCWYHNHRSKQTLEAAGMYSHTRLLRISY
ncbi:GCN5-related N-acetyltransferase [Oscillochloris trichoides DG-6]|uniref:GCN5-related N-acetyltransferase n=1 Tax=Oscillochloris trichoides DG-6 TaxID=765420 RepID=E1IEQ6_9CHLR|nr:GNAT family N-acetyltransferase [Oscillochloris trichoides]EFO80348.1 GCN5-related N-acetyltransferase [Oscillochloris trichoides DG-6]